MGERAGQPPDWMSVVGVLAFCDESVIQSLAQAELRKDELDSDVGWAGHPSAIAQGKLSRKARELAHPQLFRFGC